ncbi:hypothetical protein ACNO6Y_22315, partial [Vibrio owensii]|uniref:hypothetical protein n=1 Tax=Vibrio owensii TaxID=696485 RepID=UPI003AAC18AD
SVVVFMDNIKNATFINCKFYDCNSIINDISSNSVEFLNCTSSNEFMSELEECQEEEKSDDITELTKQIFRKFFPVGSGSCERVHIPLASVYKIQSQGYTKREITYEIKKLKREGLLKDAQESSYVAINIQKMAEIKQLLGKV